MPVIKIAQNARNRGDIAWGIPSLIYPLLIGLKPLLFLLFQVHVESSGQQLQVVHDDLLRRG